MKTSQKVRRRLNIKKKSRLAVQGTPEKPRLCIFRSNKDIYVQLIDDSEGKTILSASSKEGDLATDKSTKTDKAKKVGLVIAEKALANKIEYIKFDRNGYLYHGRIKALAEGAREGGLKF